jgi:predicted ATP-dependent serine protease
VAAWGEVGLGGEVRQVPFEARRREEAARIGLDHIVAPGTGGGLRLDNALLLAGLVR